MTNIIGLNRRSLTASLAAWIMVSRLCAPNAVVAAWIPSSFQKQEVVTAEQHVQNAQRLIQSKNYGDAKTELRLALSLDRQSPQANLLLALVYKSEQKSKDAIKYVEAAIKAQPNYAHAHYLLALLLFEKNDLARSRDEIDLAISQGANFPSAFTLKGDINLVQSNKKVALEAYEEALRLGGPKDEDATMLRERVAALKNYIDFGSHPGDASYVRPVLLNRPMPRYTDVARQNNIQGTVKLAVLVDERGAVTSVLILSRLGYGLDGEAANAAKTLLFSPAKKDGKPVPYWTPVLVEFNLKFEMYRLN